MELNKDVMQAVESLGYRVTVGDVASRAGLNVEVAQQGVLALASETQANMQVAESGDVAYVFPRNFRGVLRNKYWQLRFQEMLSKIWQVVFYVVRVSFGIMLLVSIAIIAIAISAIKEPGNTIKKRIILSLVYFYRMFLLKAVISRLIFISRFSLRLGGLILFGCHVLHLG
ncbi:MAG: hypothetical protein AAFY72_11215 [Cyanobacteria bacterium J06649_4]